MIPRLLVPFDARPSTLEPTARRRPSTLDDRTLVPSGLPVVHLDGKSNIPTNLPLESIAKRFIVPRDINPEAYSVVEEPHALPPQPSELDQRITVPLGAASPEIIPPPQLIPTDMVEKNVFLTGEVNFLGDEEAAAKLYRKNLVDRAISVVVHATVILLLIFPPTFLRRHPPTPGELEIARKQMTLLLPPGAFEMSRPEPRATPPPRVKVDPRVLRKIAPPEPVPEPAPQPKTPARELPSAPTVKPEANQPPPAPTPKSEAPPNHAPKLETPDAPTTKPNLILPKNISPGRSIEDSLRSSASAKANAPQAMGGGGQLPGSGVPRSGGQGTAYGNLEMLTPTEGVDFRDYLHRVYITVKRNWFAVMPESVNLGEKGVVSLQFKIMRDGSVPGDEPAVLYTSQKEPLDRAAVSSIRSSNPFESLPPAFKGPYIELRFTYYYNLVPSNGPP